MLGIVPRQYSNMYCTGSSNVVHISMRKQTEVGYGHNIPLF